MFSRGFFMATSRARFLAYNPAAAGSVAAVPEPSVTLLGVAIACLIRFALDPHAS
jgi:hypothetical protein